MNAKRVMGIVLSLGVMNVFATEEVKDKWQEYQKSLNVKVITWKKEKKIEYRELMKQKKMILEELQRERESELSIIDESFAQKITALNILSMKKSIQFDERRDLALIQSIKLKREKFNQKRPVWIKFYKDLNAIESTFASSIKDFKVESFKEKIDLFNSNKPDFLEDSPEKICKVQNYYKKQQVNLDYHFAKYEKIIPRKVNLKHIENIKKFYEDEVAELQENIETIKILSEAAGRDTKHLQRVESQLAKAQGKLLEYETKYFNSFDQLSFVESAIDNSKAVVDKTCDMTTEIADLVSPRVVSEKSRVGAL